MARNVEIKARARDAATLHRRALELSRRPPTVLQQDDVFYGCQTGRLKLRRETGRIGQLIWYQRPNMEGPKISQYSIVEVESAALLDSLLSEALGRIGVVSKTRSLYIVDQTRIHLDEVEGLGNFLELEVVLRSDQTTEDGETVACKLMTALEVDDCDLLSGAYIDMLT